MDSYDKTRENRARRAAERLGFRLEKSRRRDRYALDYGKYQLIDTATNAAEPLGDDGWLTLGQVETRLRLVVADHDPALVGLVRALVPVAMAFAPPYGLDSRTVERLAGPVEAAAKLLDGGMIDELIAAVRGIVTGLPPAPPDYLKISPLLDGLREGLHQYEEATKPGPDAPGTFPPTS